MPAKIDTELNLRFLYICFKHSNFSTVDFHEVASYFQIKAPAARMRLMRLRQALEAESSQEGFKERDRKRRLNPFKAKDKMYAHDGEDDDDESLDDVPLMQRFHARMMRIKREEGLMIKNEDGTLIKDEDATMVKKEDDDFWGKKEECVGEQEENGMANAGAREVGGTSYFKDDANDSHLDLQKRTPSVNMEAAVKSETGSMGYVPFSYPSSNGGPTVAKPQIISHLDTQHRTAYLDPVKMKHRDHGYGRDQHTPAHPANISSFNFRSSGHANTSSPYVHEHSDINKSEHINNNGFSAPFRGYDSSPRPNAFNPFAQTRPESTYSSAHILTPSGLDSPFRLDMFNTALTNSIASEVESSPGQKSVNSTVDSPMISDDTSETRFDNDYMSPLARQSYQNKNF
ncbi:hypothetical protein QM012_004784 [Aureobasidium pullulans]|uniref:Myb-like DNA-binding domain-containing protein n=1 Tax=Aureobasidium pullulans TaxID=5580 RepID=A0ABR0TVV3_AURPU